MYGNTIIFVDEVWWEENRNRAFHCIVRNVILHSPMGAIATKREFRIEVIVVWHFFFDNYIRLYMCACGSYAFTVCARARVCVCTNSCTLHRLNFPFLCHITHRSDGNQLSGKFWREHKLDLSIDMTLHW